MKKVVVCFISLALSLGLLGNQISVKAVSNQETGNVSAMFREFITECFADEENVQVYIGAKNVTDLYYRCSYRGKAKFKPFVIIPSETLDYGLVNRSFTLSV